MNNYKNKLKMSRHIARIYAGALLRQKGRARAPESAVLLEARSLESEFGFLLATRHAMRTYLNGSQPGART